MKRFLTRLVKLAVVGWLAAAAVSMAAAMRAKGDAPPLPDPSDDEIDVRAIFEGLQFQSTAQQFRGGKLVCWFGGGMLDLRSATLDPAGAHLDVRALYGGAALIVPEAWNVTLRVRGMGGAGDNRPTRDRDPDGPVLTIEGLVFAGGFSVASEVPSEG